MLCRSCVAPCRTPEILNDSAVSLPREYRVDTPSDTAGGGEGVCPRMPRTEKWRQNPDAPAHTPPLVRIPGRWGVGVPLPVGVSPPRGACDILSDLRPSFAHYI